MPKTSFRRKSRTPRKSYRPRTYRRKRSAKKQSLGIGSTRMIYCKARCPQVIEIQGTSDTNAFTSYTLALPWQRPRSDTLGTSDGVQLLETGGPARYTYLVQSSVFTNPRFIGGQSQWKQYAITGMQIKYFPTATIATAPGSPTHPIYGYYMASLDEYADGVLQGVESLVVQNGFKAMGSVYRPWTKYISFKQISKKEHLNWQNTGSSLPSTFGSGELSPAWSMIRIGLSNTSGALSDAGFFKVTWYVTFRGQP